jgi:hypothetical protein
MQDPSSYNLAARQAWSIYRERCDDPVSYDDARRSLLERFLRERWEDRLETELEELTCSGLAFLSRVNVTPEEQ